MKRTVLLLVLLFASLSAFSQVEVYLGAGKLLTSSSGNAFIYKAEYETNYNAGVRFWASPKFSFNLNLMRDTAKIGEWAYEHNFIEKLPVHAYNYTAIGTGVEWWPVENAYVFLAPTYFTSPDKDIESKFGIAAGGGFHHRLYKSLTWQTELRYVHVQDFIVPVANGVIWSFRIGYRF